MGWLKDTETAIDIVLARLQELDAKTDETRANVQTLEVDVEEAMNGALAKTQEFTDYLGDVVENDLPHLLDPIVYQVEDRTDKAATELDNFLFQLEDVAASGNLWAEQLVGIIHSVREGIVSAEDAMKSMGDGLAQFDGEIRPVRDILQDLLPTMGEVQRGIDDTVRKLEEEGTTIEDLTRRLRQQHNTYAQDLARLITAWQEGRATIEAVIQAAQRLQETLPGSESDALAGILRGLLMDDDD